MLKTPVYRFDIYGRYRTLWTDGDNFWQCYLELVYKPKYQILCKSGFPCSEDPEYRFGLYGMYQILWTDIAHFQYRPMASRSVFAKFRLRSALRSDAIVITTHSRTEGRTDRHISNILEFRADQISPINIGSQINISMHPTRIDKTNIPSMWYQ